MTMMKTDEQVLKEIGEAAAGLLLMSESDCPLEPFRLEGERDAGGQPDLGRLRRLAEVSEDAPVEVIGFDEFFRAAVFVTLKREGGGEKAAEDRVGILRRALTDNLSGLSVYRVGSISIAVYVVGRSAEGNFVGLSTRVVET